jgi:hypothetical protein
MSSSALKERLLAAGIVAGLMWAAPAAPAMVQQNAAPPDFSWDHTIAWVGVGGNGPGFAAVPGRLPPVSGDPAHPFVPNLVGKQPTYRIADLNNPNLKPWVKEHMKKDVDEVLAGKVAFTAGSSCQPGGVPGFMLYGGPVGVYFIQTPKQVWMIYSGDHQVRRVYMDVPHSENPKPSWYGESVGHYEGDALVVDTIGLNDKSFVDNYRTPHTDRIHVVERFRMIEGGRILQATVTVDDPGAFNMPWSAVQRWRRVADRTMTESICAENNYDFFNYKVVPIPQADRLDF